MNNQTLLYVKKGKMKWHVVCTGMRWHDMIAVPPPSIFDNSQLNTPTDYTLTWPFLWVPECIQIEKRLAVGGTHQPPKCTLHTCANCGMWGQWTLLAALNPASIYSLDAPQLDMKGLHVGGDCLLRSWKNSWRGSFHCLFCRLRDFGMLPVGSWGARWETVVEGVRWAFLEGVKLRMRRGVLWLSSEAHKNLLPPSQPPLPPLFPGLWSPFPMLLLLVYMLPLSSH